MNDTINTLLSHRSFRSFRDEPVSEEQLDQIIQAVQAAPNWINGQQVTVIAIKDRERKKKFAELCGGQKHI
ncbi:MAG TPA: nitroreductase family protein, partial [Chondromyces sp.]|nr:nitroreductase family protein [Chondromyces sp.]